jgi:hypothetical protein
MNGSGGARLRRDAGSPTSREASPDGFSAGGFAGKSPGDAGSDALVDAGAALVGHYDVWIDDPKVSGCEVAVGTLRLNLYVDLVKGQLSALYFEDYIWAAGPTNVSSAARYLSIEPFGRGLFPEVRPSLSLSLTTDGDLAGTGTASVPLACSDGSAAVAINVPVRVGPDVTPPRVRLDPTTPAPWFMPFTWYLISASEPLEPHPDWDVSATEDAGTLNGRVALVDATTGSIVPFDLVPWPWGGGAGVSLTDHDAMVGKSIGLVLTGSLTDRAGNAAIAEPTTFEIHDAGPIMTRIDFDNGAPRGLYGTAKYYAPGAPDAPCESGGCVAVDGIAEHCDPNDNRVAGAVAVRIDASGQVEEQIRYRVLSEGDLLFEGRLAGALCGYPLGIKLHPLSVPVDGVFSFASDWTTQRAGPCTGPSADDGLMVLPPCPQSPQTKQRVRIVVDWIDAVPWSPFDGGTKKPVPP